DIRERTFSCPACSGVLLERREGGASEFKCLVGHRYSWENLVASQSEATESALWAGVRSLTERAEISRRLLTDAQRTKNARLATHFRRRIESLERDAGLIRKMIEREIKD
ncbi:MAG: hypothetical protein JO102_02830, partial [Elusimicrobia bacterium]|nr:hypothetical protein [Elusimicrobiota bacterium]